MLSYLRQMLVPRFLMHAVAMTYQNTAGVVHGDFAIQRPCEKLPNELAGPAERHGQQAIAGREYTRASGHFLPYLAIIAPLSAVVELPPTGDCGRENAQFSPSKQRRGNFKVLLLILLPLACFGLTCGLMPTLVEPTLIEPPPPPVLDASFERLVDQIVTTESRGDSNAKNKRSSATGAGQFLDQTWLELVRAHRRELLTGRTEKEVLNLRKDLELSREMTRRFIERNAVALAKRGLPVTPSTLYLAHFAGPAGAVAILTSPGEADAALVMANADSRPEVTRTKILNSNPFLRDFTVEDLKNWAKMKMEGIATR